MSDSTQDPHPPSVYDREHATDTGNINRAVRIIRKTNPTGYVVERDAFIVWYRHASREEVGHEVGWYEVDLGNVQMMSLTGMVIDDIRREAQLQVTQDDVNRWNNHALKTESLDARRRIINGLKQDRRVVVPFEGLDANPYHLVTLSGTVLLDQYEYNGDAKCDALRVIDCAPEHLNTRHVPTRVVWDARSELLDRYLDKFLPDESVRAYTLETIAECLPAGNAGKILIVIIGPRDSGKSTFMELVRRTLGEYVKVAPQSIYHGNQSDRPRPDVIDALPARIVYTVEASEAWKLHADQIKRLTGSVDAIKVRGMASNNFIERTPDFTPIVIGNEMPHIVGADEAVRSRVKVLYFGQRTEKTTEGEREQLELLSSEEVREAFLALLLRARAERIARGAPLPAPRALDDPTLSAYDALSDVHRFIGDMEETGEIRRVDPEAVPNIRFISAKHVYALWTRWAKANGMEPGTARALNRKLEEECGWVRVESTGKRWSGWVPGEIDLAAGSEVSL